MLVCLSQLFTLPLQNGLRGNCPEGENVVDIYRFQARGLNALLLRIFVTTLIAMNLLESRIHEHDKRLRNYNVQLRLVWGGVFSDSKFGPPQHPPPPQSKIP